ncbi:hypothetical protein H257_13808 [Aphanomyces astaci]|uniref:CCHC-type domain-containing protein n=1 Tax=Aphanomyces astaci TaxID=112090 RepID=W4FT78_APHAT|nr:hypothetical protein H257_13808 [Aphanomyces astaci]ETV70710.1 hypothetical protein H257_13808 [Aphanomyces astaci]|eukprot:XP_009839774.1 hypothetical protein H257_13808 [Aphanomyces astaci]
MAKNSKDRAQKPKVAATAPAAASSETEEEVQVTEPPLVPVVGWTTDVLPAVEESKSEEVRKTMEELAAANKATGSARAASMTWDESRRRYGGQTMGRTGNNYHDPQSKAPMSTKTTRRQKISEKRAEEDEKEYQEEQRKQAERRRINKANRPAKEKRVDHAKVARAAHDRRMLDTTLPSSSGWGPLTSGPPTPSSGGWGPNFNSSGPSLVVTHVQPPRITCMDRTFLVSWVKKRETYEDKLRANAQRMGGEWRRMPVEQLSEDDYRDRIMEIVGQPATKWTPTMSDMQNYCRTLSIDPHGDVTSRLVSFMERVDDVIDENGLRQQLKDATMLRTLVKVVAARVTPSYLRDRVEEQIKTVPANDLVAFADILREQPDRTHDADMDNQQRNSYGSKRGREEDDQGRRITKHAKKANKAVRDQRELRGNYPRPPGGYIKPERSAAVWSPSTQKQSGDPPATEYGPQANSRPRHDDRHVQAVRDEARPEFAPGRDDRGMLCFVCQQPGHMARECPIKKDGDSGDTSWKKGKNAVKRFKARERKANMQAKRMKKPPPPSKEDDGRWVRLNSVLEVPYCPDTGADQNIVPQAMVDELQVLQPQLQVVKLAAPFVPGKRRCYVVNDGDEFVSDDTLKTIGIDIDRLLEQVARLQVDEDGDDLEEVGGDCVELPQRSAVRAATMKAVLPVAKNEVEEALQGMIDGAVDNGFPMEHVKYLWDVLSKHDIWRIKFDGSDPPAKVKPLKPTPSLATKRVKIRRGHGRSKKVKTRKVPPPAQPKLRPLNKEIVWPCVMDIRHAEDQHGETKPKRATVVNTNTLWQGDERLWIPGAANDLIQRIMVVAYCGSAGHRGHAALVATIRRLFYVDHLPDRASEFLRWSINRMLRDGTRKSATKESTSTKYVLVLKDDLTHYCELIACDGPTSQVCVDALVDSTKRFGMPRVWVSDQGTHFKNVAMKALANKFKVHHYLTLAYCPWRNGTVERMNRDILQVMRVMLREYQLAEQEWDYLLSMVQANLNQTPAASLASKSPMELFTALNPATPLDVVVVGMNKELRESDWTVMDIPKNLDKLRASLQVMHKEVLDKNAMRAAKATKTTEKYEQCNVSEGDYLLVTWTGPYRVKEVGEFSVVLEHLVTHELREAHASRVKLYAEDSFEVTEEILEHVSEQMIMLKVKSIAGHKFVPLEKDFMLEVLWEGFEDIESSWEPLQKLMHECPAIVKNYVEGVKTASEGNALRKAMKRVKAKN